MKRSTASWTTAIAASALLALPVGSWAQQTTPSATPRQQTPGAAAPQTPGADMQKGSANEHLRQAQSALADIPEASLTGTTKTRVAELKRHLNKLEQAASQKPESGSTAPRTASANWSGDVAAADRILTELLGSASTTGASTPAPTGTSGSTATAAKTLDESARSKLQEVRTHVTAFAAAMSGGSASTPRSDEPSAAASASATPSAATATPSPTGTSGTTPAPSEPAATPATPSEPAAPAPATPAQAQPPAESPTTPSPTPSQQVDADIVKRHLTAARDTLSQLTQLPAAAQLTGDARTQVSQLISNFNELITTNTDWRSAYTKLQGNLTALVGEKSADESPAPAPATGTPGAVGTSGATAIDPAIRAKLIEFRSHLAEFEKAAGGGSGAPAAKEPAAEPAQPSAAASATAAPSASSSTTASAATPSSPSSTSSSTTASPAPAGTTGSTAQTPATAGTSGTGTPMPAAAEQATKPSTSGREAREATSSQAAEGHREAMTHIEAIESILNGASPAGTSGTAAAAKPGTLDRAQVEQIRKHLADLRKELNKSR
jgi:hypothetical protein